MTKEQMMQVMSDVFAECQALREAGQKEYAHRNENAFANFERLAERMGISRESVLMVYAEKHMDGIHSYIKGHKSQREDVRGRINDVIVYLCLLRGMVNENMGERLSTPIATSARREVEEDRRSSQYASGIHNG